MEITERNIETKDFGSVSESLIHEFEAIVGNPHVVTGKALLDDYSNDQTQGNACTPDVVLKPDTPEAISAILTLCHAHRIPVTPRGGGTGLAGGAIPVYKGVVIAMERFNRIIDIDELNLQATVEPGVITEVFQDAVKEKGLFYPPDPASKGSCFLGGNLSHNSGGPKAVKYGVTRDYVLNMEVVLATGEIIWTAANVLKNSTGYNLTQLMCGSEGTLGIITKIVFKLRGYPQKNALLFIPFANNEEACKAISAIFIAGITPSGMEFFEREAGELTIAYCKEVLSSPVVTSLPEGMQAFLLCELDGNDTAVIMRDAERVITIVEKFNAGDVLFAESAMEKEQLWKIRVNISPAIKWASEKKSEDVVVPRHNLPQLVVGVKKIGKEYGFNTVCFGHLGDGNMHINILRDQMSEHDWSTHVPKGISAIFTLVVSLGGTLSGEHGIGIEKSPYMPLAMKQKNIALMRGIKNTFDPAGILNPGKIF